MNEPKAPTPNSVPEPASSNIEITGGDVRAGRDIVGGNVNVAGDSISGQTVSVQRGFSASDVQRLIIIVGALVFVTAAFFFVLGAIASAAVVGALQRPLPNGSQPASAESMQQKINAMNSLQSGQQFQVRFSEEEVSSYLHFIAGPQLGISNAKARFLTEPGQIAVGGNLDAFGGRPFVGQISITTNDTPLELKAAWVKLLPTPEGSSIGYFPVAAFTGNLGRQINNALFGRVQFTRVAQSGGGSGSQPETGTNLFLTGVAK